MEQNKMFWLEDRGMSNIHCTKQQKKMRRKKN